MKWTIRTRSEQRSRFSTLGLVVLLTGCGSPGFEHEVTATVDPHGISPLTALIRISANAPCKATVRLMSDDRISYEVEEASTSMDLPVVGLYPGKTDHAVLTLEYEGGTVNDTVTLSTAPLPDYFPRIEINVLNRAAMEPGFHLCDLHFADDGTFDSRPMIFDDEGIVRWYLDLSSFGDILWPIQRSSDGVLLVGGQHEIHEYDMLGKLLKKHELDTGIRVHHEILELPGGQWLIPIRKDGMVMTVDGETIPSLNDLFILYDRRTSTILREWDLGDVLDVSRNDVNTMTKSDWIHVNGLAFDPTDSTIIVSAKNQALLKVTWNNELRWIMAADRNWGKAGRNGDGSETRPFLLKPIALDGTPYGRDVQEGIISPEDFDLPWGQHAPELLPNGHILVYDNGFMRNFEQKATYSRAVEYEVDEAKMTVKQIWEYGKDRGPYFFSLLISDVDKLEKTDNVLVTSGYIVDGTTKIVEVTYPDGEVVFEATLFHKTLKGNKTFNWGQLDLVYRSERFDLRY